VLAISMATCFSGLSSELAIKESNADKMPGCDNDLDKIALA
jgi:hypothetical protein